MENGHIQMETEFIMTTETRYFRPKNGCNWTETELVQTQTRYYCAYRGGNFKLIWETETRYFLRETGDKLDTFLRKQNIWTETELLLPTETRYFRAEIGYIQTESILILTTYILLYQNRIYSNGN